MVDVRLMCNREAASGEGLCEGQIAGLRAVCVIE